MVVLFQHNKKTAKERNPQIELIKFTLKQFTN